MSSFSFFHPRGSSSSSFADLSLNSQSLRLTSNTLYRPFGSHAPYYIFLQVSSRFSRTTGHSTRLVLSPTDLSYFVLIYLRHQHRTSLIITTSLAFILHILASSNLHSLPRSRGISCLRRAQSSQPCSRTRHLFVPLPFSPPSNFSFSSGLNLCSFSLTAHRPFECDLAQMLHCISTRNAVSFVFRLGVLHSTPMKNSSTKKISFEEFLESESA